MAKKKNEEFKFINDDTEECMALNRLYSEAEDFVSARYLMQHHMDRISGDAWDFIIDRNKNDYKTLGALVKRNKGVKVILKNVDPDGDGHIKDAYICGTCRKYVDDSTFNFCPRCGQRIDWTVGPNK